MFPGVRRLNLRVPSGGVFHSRHLSLPTARLPLRLDLVPTELLRGEVADDARGRGGEALVDRGDAGGACEKRSADATWHGYLGPGARSPPDLENSRTV